MKNWLFLGAIFSSALASSVLFNYFSLFGVKPDLLLICAVASAVYLPKRKALFYCFFCGLLKDTLSINYFAANTILFCLLGWLIIRLAKEFNLDDEYIFIGLIAAGSLLTSLATRVFFFYASKQVPLGIFLRVLLIGCFYTTLIAWLAIKSIPFWEKFIKKNNADQNT